MNRRVLIADDDDDMRELLRMVLTSASYEVVAATDGEAALQMWHAERAMGLCAVVLDQRMPGIYGTEVAKAIHVADPTQTIILLSAYIDADTEALARSTGIAACVPKQNVLEFPHHPVLKAACPGH